MPSAVCTCKFIDPSVCAFAASQYTPGISSTGPVISRSRNRSALLVCSRSIRCLISGAGYCGCIRPETEYSSSLRLTTTVVFIGNRSSLPAWSMCRWVWQTKRTSPMRTPWRASWFSIMFSWNWSPHAERLHDLIGAVAGIDDDWIGASGNEKAECQHTPCAPAVAAEHQEARFQLDVAIVENLDFQRHVCLPFPRLFSPRRAIARDDRPASPYRAGSRRDGAGSAWWRRDRRRRDRDSWSTTSRSENSSRTGSDRLRRSPLNRQGYRRCARGRCDE